MSTAIHDTYKQQFGRHNVELGSELTEHYVRLSRGDVELDKAYFLEYADAQRAFYLVQSALEDIDNEGWGYENENENPNQG